MNLPDVAELRLLFAGAYISGMIIFVCLLNHSKVSAVIIHHQKKFVVFQAWKSASSTLYRRLEKFNDSPYSRFYDFNPYLQRIVHQHMTVADLKALPEYRPDDRFAAFVRNPYDRVYSGFIQIQRDLQQQPAMPFPADWIREHVMGQLALNAKRLQDAAFDFDAWVGLLKAADIYETGLNSSLPLHPAHYWTHDGEKVFTGFIGKVEHFEADFRRMLEYLGIDEEIGMANENLSDSPAPENTYRYVHLMSAATIDRINMLFEKDFQLFDYPFA